MKQEIYLDNSATTRPLDSVIRHMSEVALMTYGNPSSLHRMGIEAEKLIKAARESIARVLDVDSREIYFTSGGTESDNLAIRGYLNANPRKGRQIITSKIEHPAVLEVFKYMSAQGYEVDYIDVDSRGIVDLEQLKSRISSNTALISIMLVNNETGAIQPIDEIAALRNTLNRNAVIHVDAVQGFGKMPVHPSKSGIDLLSVSSHKIHGPKGVGALYINKGIKIKPVVFGGGQESSLRSGTENVPGIAGFGMAADEIALRMGENARTAAALKERLIMGITESIDDVRIISPAESSPFILNVSFMNVHAEVLLHFLEDKGIYISTGSACSSRKNVHSHVLKSMCVDAAEIEGAVRFSFSGFNTMEEIEYTIDSIKEIIPRIRVNRTIKRK